MGYLALALETSCVYHLCETGTDILRLCTRGKRSTVNSVGKNDIGHSTTGSQIPQAYFKQAHPADAGGAAVNFPAKAHSPPFLERKRRVFLWGVQVCKKGKVGWENDQYFGLSWKLWM